MTTAVKAGDLYLCEKAFSHAYAAEDDNSRMSVLMNIEECRGFKGGEADLITLSVQKLYLTQSLIPTFVALHRVNYQSTDVSTVDGTPIVDT